MAFEVIGKLYRVFPIEQKTATFQTREFVLEIVSGQYPEYVKFQAIQDRCQLLDAFQEGDVVKVSFDLRGREWQGKFFTNLNAWRVEKADGNAATTSAPEQTSADPFPDYTAGPPPAITDDLPF